MQARVRTAITIAAAAGCLTAIAAPAQADAAPQFIPPTRGALPDLGLLPCAVYSIEDLLADALGRPRVVLSQGHVDVVGVNYENSKLKISYNDGTAGEEEEVQRDPATVLSVAKPQSQVTVPDDPAYAFLGTPGTPVWVLPEVQDEELLFPGLSTEDISAGLFTDNNVTIRFQKVCGPDGVSLFTTGPGGEPHILVDSEDGLPDLVNLPTGTHMHENWAFEAPGKYKIVIDATAKLAATGQQITSKPEVLTFEVQP